MAGFKFSGSRGGSSSATVDPTQLATEVQNAVAGEPTIAKTAQLAALQAELDAEKAKVTLLETTQATQDTQLATVDIIDNNDGTITWTKPDGTPVIIDDTDVHHQNGALTGSAGSYSLGVDDVTQKIYIPDDSGNWIKASSGITTDNAANWKANHDHTVEPYIFAFTPTQLTPVDIDGNTLEQNKTYLGKYRVPKTSSASLTLAEIALIEVVAGGSSESVTVYKPADETERLALTGLKQGDIIIQQDTEGEYKYDGTAQIRQFIGVDYIGLQSKWPAAKRGQVFKAVDDNKKYYCRATSGDVAAIQIDNILADNSGVITAGDGSMTVDAVTVPSFWEEFSEDAADLTLYKTNLIQDAKDTSQDSEILLRELLANKVVSIGTTGNDINYPTEKAVRDAIDAINFAGDYQGSSTTFAGLPNPTSANGNWAILSADDGANVAGIYVTDGTTYSIAKPIPDIAELVDTTIAPGDADYSNTGTVSVAKLDQWGVSRRVDRVFNVNANFDFRALGYAPRTAVFIRNIDNANGVNITFGIGGSHTIVGTKADGTAITGTDFFNLQPSEFLVMEDDMDGVTVRASIVPAERVKVFPNYSSANTFGALPHDGIVLIQDTEEVWARKSAVNGVFFPADGVENADWGIFGGKNNFVQTGTTAEKVALGLVPSSTPFFDTDLGKLQYYKTSSEVFTINKAATDLPYLVEWANANSVFSNMQFKITTSATETIDNSTINLPDGEDVLLYIIGRQFFNGSIAANTLGGAFTVRNDNGTLTLVSIEPNRYWGGGLDYTTMSYTDFPNLVASPIGISISDVNAILTNIAGAGVWTNLDGTLAQSQSLEDFKPLTAYATGERFVAPMPVNADFISNNGAIVNVDYIFEANTDIPNTIAAFDEAQADSGNYDLVGVFRTSGTQDRVLTGAGIMLLDPLSDLSNTSLDEYIHWTTTDTPKTIRLVPAPAFVTIWKDYTGNNIPQPTAANEDFVLPADSQMWVHRTGNSIQITFESNKGGSSGETDYFLTLKYSLTGQNGNTILPALTLPQGAIVRAAENTFVTDVNGDKLISTVPTNPADINVASVAADGAVTLDRASEDDEIDVYLGVQVSSTDLSAWTQLQEDKIVDGRDNAKQENFIRYFGGVRNLDGFFENNIEYVISNYAAPNTGMTLYSANPIYNEDGIISVVANSRNEIYVPGGSFIKFVRAKDIAYVLYNAGSIILTSQPNNITGRKPNVTRILNYSGVGDFVLNDTSFMQPGTYYKFINGNGKNITITPFAGQKINGIVDGTILTNTVNEFIELFYKGDNDWSYVKVGQAVDQQVIGTALVEERGIFKEIHDDVVGVSAGEVIFPDGGFSSAPKVQATAETNGHIINIPNVSATGFTYDQWDVEDIKQGGNFTYYAKGLKP